MLDQDTARALLELDRRPALRVALVGDRHQLPAVGRGGVLDLAARYAPDRVGRARQGASLHRPGVRRAVLADAHAASEPVRCSTSWCRRGRGRGPRQRGRTQRRSRPRAARGDPGGRRHPRAGRADQRTDPRVRRRHRRGLRRARHRGRASGSAIGDRASPPAATTATSESPTGRSGRSRRPATARSRFVAEAGARTCRPPTCREHVELAYATTAYGAQGATVPTAHVLIGEHTGGASAYVGMTRGRERNVAHLVADTTEDARPPMGRGVRPRPRRPRSESRAAAGGVGRRPLRSDSTAASRGAAACPSTVAVSGDRGIGL